MVHINTLSSAPNITRADNDADLNACRKEQENAMAEHYANAYGLIHFAGTDNHTAGKRKTFGGMECETPITDEQDFIAKVLSGEMKPFRLEVE